MQAEKVGIRATQESIVMTNPMQLHGIRTRVLLGAIVAAALVTAALANVCTARPDEAVGAAGGAAETVTPGAGVERSGSLAAYPPLY
jgi:hypothetical protein